MNLLCCLAMALQAGADDGMPRSLQEENPPGCESWFLRPPYGVIAGYRLVRPRKERIQSEIFMGIWTSPDPKENEAIPYGIVSLGAGLDGKSEAQRNPEFEDEWAHISLELELGAQWTLAQSKNHRLWTSVGLQGMVLRAVQHHAGPNGEHDPVEGDHEIHGFGGGGLVLRLGSSHRAAGMDVEPSFGISAISLGGLGTGYMLEFSLNFRF